jgi:excisionase family DNA binding protein
MTEATIGTAEACRILGINRSTLMRWTHQGKIPSQKLPGTTGTRLFDRHDVERLAAQIAEQAANTG